MKNLEVLVSIIVPIYNKQEYLEKCLKSLKNQTCKNIEILMIDDGSSDCSKDICKEYERIDNRFKYFYQDNSGVSVARNLGLHNSKGEWIMFVDPDDYVEVKLVEVLLSEINNDIDIISCCCMANYDGKLILNEFYESDYLFDSKNDIVDLNMLLMDDQYKAKTQRFTAIGVPWGKLYRNSMLQKYKLKFDKDLKRMQDNIFNMYAFGIARKIKYINNPLYIYSCDNITIVNNKFDENASQYYSKITDLRQEYLIKNKLIEVLKVRDAFNNEIYKLLSITIKRNFLHKKNKQISLWKKSKVLKEYIKENNYDKVLDSIKQQSNISSSKYFKVMLLSKNVYLYSLLLTIKKR